MRAIAIAVSYLACATQGLPASTVAEQSPINPFAESNRRASATSALNPLGIFARFLLTSSPAATFNPSGLGALVTVGDPFNAGLRPLCAYRSPLMRANCEMFGSRRGEMSKVGKEIDSVPGPSALGFFSRRQLAACVAAAAGLLSRPSFAAGGVQWTIDLPPEFKVERKLASIVRVKTETMLLADDKKTGAQVKLVLLPFGQQAGTNLNDKEQLSLLDTLLKKGPVDAAGAENVANAMTASVTRSPAVTDLTRTGDAKVYAADGRQYVQYDYVAKKCLGLVEDGECDGKKQKRRSLSAVTVSSISQFRTNSEREQMREDGVTRNVQVIWLLTVSAPEGASWKSLEPTLEQARASFRVPVVDNIL